MALEVGELMSKKLVEDIKASLTRNEITLAAIEAGSTWETARVLLQRTQTLSDFNIKVAKSMMAKAYHINKLEIRKRDAINRTLESLIAETAA